MANQKISILMEAVNKFSQPAKVMSHSAGKLTDELQQTTHTLNALGKKEKQISRFKGLTTRLEKTREQVSENRVETDRLKQSELQAISVVKDHSRALRRAEQHVLDMAQAYGDESDEVAKANTEVRALSKLKRSAVTELKKERAELKRTTQASKRLATSYTKQAEELGGLKADLGKAGIKINSLGAHELKLAKQTAKANKELERQRDQLKEVNSLKERIEARDAKKGDLAGDAVGVAAAAIPLVMAGARAIEYESTFADVKKVVDFKDQKEENAYKSQMMKLAGNLGVEQEGIAEIVTAAGQSGIEKDQLLQFASSATKMSVAWDVSAEDAGSTLATWRAAMGLTQKNALDLADATNYLSNNMNAKAKDIAAVMVRQGSTAMGAGFNANETAALSASLIAGGATEETAATALKNISGSLTAGYSASKSKAEAMDRLGFDPEQLASDMQKDAQGTLVGVLKELQGVSDDERGAVISELFGEEIKGAVSKLVITLNDDKNGLISAFSKVANQADRAGSVNQEYANRANTRSHSLAQLGAKFDRMTIAIGDRLLPVLDAVLPPLMTVVDAVADFAESSPDITSGLLAAVGAIGVFKAGAIAFKAIKLFGGNALDRRRLSQLSGSTDQTSISANRAARSLALLNNRLNNLGRNGGRGPAGRAGRRPSVDTGGRNAGRSGRRSGFSRLLEAENQINQSGESRTSRPNRNGAGRGAGRRAGRLGRLAGLFGMGESRRRAGSRGAGGLLDTLPANTGLLRGAGKFFKPLGFALSGMALTTAMSEGNNEQMGATAGDMAGGLGGAAAGAMAGAAIGSVVPIIGTAVGGLLGSIVGGLGGGAIGEWAGSKVGGLFNDDEGQQGEDAEPSTLNRLSNWLGDQLPNWMSEDKTAQPIANASINGSANQLAQQQSNTKQASVSFAPVINLTPTGNPSYDQDLSNQIIDRLKSELIPTLMGSSAVAMSADASLSDNQTS